MKSFWDQRYSEQGFVYGEEPNEYFRDYLDSGTQKPGRLLLPGEGEGRNAVYAAQKGWEVCAFDQSETGRDKALQLAANRGVQIQYDALDLRSYPFADNSFDLIGLFFFHLPTELRAFAHPWFVRALKPGGTLIAELFSKDQLGKASGGPQSSDMLYDLESLASDFSELDIQYLAAGNTVLNEGKYHVGEASVVRLIAKKEEERSL